MKVAQFSNHGDPDVLQIEQIAEPQPERGEVVVRLAAASLNRVDLWTRQGWPGLKLKLPHILGSDGAGVVESLGQEASTFSVGDRVVINPTISDSTCDFCLQGSDHLCRNWQLLGETMDGTYCEKIAVPQRNLVAMPAEYAFEKAAAAGLVFVTAWHSLIERGRLKAGERVLIVGASGGVNTASIQIAKMAGAEVWVVGSSSEKLALAERLGADRLIDRKEDEAWSRTVFKNTDRTGVDVVVDNVGAESMAQSLRAVRRGGRILTVGNTSGPTYQFDNRYMFGKQLSLIGSTMGSQTDFENVMRLVFSGTLNPVIDRKFDLEEIREAHRMLESGRQMGKIVIGINS